VILFTETLKPVVHHILVLDLGCPVVLNNGKPFALGAAGNDGGLSRFREKLSCAAMG
jgi:hypothetical protein